MARCTSGRLATLTVSVSAALALASGPAEAASSQGCDNGGFRVIAPGATVTAGGTTIVPASGLTGTIEVRGRYQQFDIDPGTLSVRHFVFTGAPNPLDMTGGVPTEAFAEKVADLRGSTLTGPLTVSLDREAIRLSRAGSGVSMGIQGKDCASGGIFQMEPRRADGGTTTFTHVLGEGVFYFDSANFRARLGEVMGEDATEVAPPATACSQDCQAQNRTGGAATVLGFPFPVPTASRL